MQSYIYDFEKSPTFFKKLNKEFDIECTGVNCFYIVLVDDICQDNIEDCINSDGQLLYDDVTHTKKASCVLKYNDIDKDTAQIVLDGDVTFNLGANMFPLKGAFLVNDNGYVLGYSIETTSFNVTNQMIFEDGLIFWDITEGERHV